MTKDIKIIKKELQEQNDFLHSILKMLNFQTGN